MKITGADDIVRVLSNLPKTTQRKAIVPSMRKAMGIVRDAAQKNVDAVTSKESTGILAKSISVYNLKKYRGSFRVAVRIKKGKVNKKKLIKGVPVRVGLYAAVLEYGKEGQPPRSWIRKAAKDSTSAVGEAVRGGIAAALPSAVEDAKR